MGNCSNPTNFSTLRFPGRQKDKECRGNVFVCFYVGVVLAVGHLSHQGYVVNVATYYSLCILLHLLLLLLPFLLMHDWYSNKQIWIPNDCRWSGGKSDNTAIGYTTSSPATPRKISGPEVAAEIARHHRPWSCSHVAVVGRNCQFSSLGLQGCVCLRGFRFLSKLLMFRWSDAPNRKSTPSSKMNTLLVTYMYPPKKQDDWEHEFH